MTATKYSTGVRFIQTFGKLEVWSFIGEGVGAVLYLVGAATGRLVLEILGVAFLMLAVLVLRAHLGQPTRGWRALTKVGNAWVSRGTLAIAIFTAAAAGSLACAYLDFLRPLEPLASAVAVVFAFPVIFYAAMMLRSMRAIHLWRGPFLPLGFPAHSAATGLTLAFAIAAVSGEGFVSWLLPSALAALVVAALLTFLHIKTVEPSPGTQASLERLRSGSMRQCYRVGAWLMGIGVPLAALLVVAATGAAPAILGIVAAAARFYGDYCYRLAIVTSGAYEPVWPSHIEFFARSPTPAKSAGPT